MIWVRKFTNLVLKNLNVLLNDKSLVRKFTYFVTDNFFTEICLVRKFTNLVLKYLETSHEFVNLRTWS